jgi:hypothetical protein
MLLVNWKIYNFRILKFFTLKNPNSLKLPKMDNSLQTTHLIWKTLLSEEKKIVTTETVVE